LSPNISDGDPHYGKLGKIARKIEPLDESKEAAFTAGVLNKFLERTHQLLRQHPQNTIRKKKGLPPANYILTRGASSLSKLPSFKKKYGLRACCIAGKFLYQQIARLLGMKIIKVRGATGKFDTNLRGKFVAAKRALKKYDFVFLHIKATDSLAEDGNYKKKKEFIEKIDRALKVVMNLKSVLVVISCDHSTCSMVKRHCGYPCPVLIYGNGKDGTKVFSEKACHRGGLGHFEQLRLMEKILELSQK